MTNLHMFEKSGLGKPPYTLIKPDIAMTPANGAMVACDHCGTQIKNLYYFSSADGHKFVVGVDCAHKSGDAGIIDSIKAHQREVKAAIRIEKIRSANEQREAKEREKLNGKTIAEAVVALETEINNLISRLAEYLNNLAWFQRDLNGGAYDASFAKSLFMQAYTSQPLTVRQKAALIDVVAKKRSGARKNSKAYLAAVTESENDISALQTVLAFNNEIRRNLGDQIYAVRSGHSAA